MIKDYFILINLAYFRSNALNLLPSNSKHSANADILKPSICLQILVSGGMTC